MDILAAVVPSNANTTKKARLTVSIAPLSLLYPHTVYVAEYGIFTYIIFYLLFLRVITESIVSVLWPELLG